MSSTAQNTLNALLRAMFNKAGVEPSGFASNADDGFVIGGAANSKVIETARNINAKANRNNLKNLAEILYKGTDFKHDNQSDTPEALAAKLAELEAAVSGSSYFKAMDAKSVEPVIRKIAAEINAQEGQDVISTSGDIKAVAKDVHEYVRAMTLADAVDFKKAHSEIKIALANISALKEHIARLTAENAKADKDLEFNREEVQKAIDFLAQRLEFQFNKLAALTSSSERPNREVDELLEAIKALETGAPHTELSARLAEHSDVHSLLLEILGQGNRDAIMMKRLDDAARTLGSSLKEIQEAARNEDDSAAARRHLEVLTKAKLQSADIDKINRAFEVIESNWGSLKTMPRVSGAGTAVGGAVGGPLPETVSSVEADPVSKAPTTPMQVLKLTESVREKLIAQYAKLLSNDIRDISIATQKINNEVRTGVIKRGEPLTKFKNTLVALSAMDVFSQGDDGVSAEQLTGYYKDADTTQKRDQLLSDVYVLDEVAKAVGKTPAISEFCKALSNFVSDMSLIKDVLTNELGSEIKLPPMHVRRVEAAVSALKRPRKDRSAGVVGGATGSRRYGTALDIKRDLSFADAIEGLNQAEDYATHRDSMISRTPGATATLDDASYKSMLGSYSANLMEDIAARTRAFAAIYSGKEDPVDVTLNDNEKALARQFSSARDAADDKSAFDARCQAAVRFLEFQGKAKIGMVKAAQAIELAAKGFAERKLSDLEMRDLVAKAANANIDTAWYSKRNGDSISEIVQSFGKDGAIAKDSYGISGDGDYKPIPADKSPFDPAFLKAGDGVDAFGDPFSSIPLRSVGQLNVFLRLAIDAVDSYKALDVILAVYEKISGDSANVKVIKKAFNMYTIASAYTIGVPNGLGVDGVSAEKVSDASIRAVYGIADGADIDGSLKAVEPYLRISMAAVPVFVDDALEETNKRDRAGQKNEFSQTDHLYSMAIQAIMGQVIVGTRLSEIYSRPLSKADKRLTVHPLKMITGGAVDTGLVKAHKDCFGLYTALPTMARWYKSLLSETQDVVNVEDFVFALIPSESGSVFKDFLTVIWKVDADSEPTHDQSLQIIGAINEIRSHYARSKAAHGKTPMEIDQTVINAFVSDIGNKISQLTKEELTEVRKKERAHLGAPAANTSLKVGSVDASRALMNRDVSAYMDDAAPAAPSDQYTDVKVKQSSLGRYNSVFSPDGNTYGDAHSSCHAKTRALFEAAYERSLAAGKNPSNNNFGKSVRDRISRFQRAETDQERLDIAIDAIKSGTGEIGSDVANERMVMFAETVITPLRLAQRYYESLILLLAIAVKIAEVGGDAAKLKPEHNHNASHVAKIGAVKAAISADGGDAPFGSHNRVKKLSDKPAELLQNFLHTAAAIGVEVRVSERGVSADFSAVSAKCKSLMISSRSMIDVFRVLFSENPAIIATVEGSVVAVGSWYHLNEFLVQCLLVNRDHTGLAECTRLINSWASGNMKDLVKSEVLNVSHGASRYPLLDYGSGDGPTKPEDNAISRPVLPVMKVSDLSKTIFPADDRISTGGMNVPVFPNLIAGFRRGQLTNSKLMAVLSQAVSIPTEKNEKTALAAIELLNVPYFVRWYGIARSAETFDPRAAFNLIFESVIKAGFNEDQTRFFSPLLVAWNASEFVGERSVSERCVIDGFNLAELQAKGPVDMTPVGVNTDFGRILSWALVNVVKNVSSTDPEQGMVYGTESTIELGVVASRKMERLLPHLAESLTALERQCKITRDLVLLDEGSADRRAAAKMLADVGKLCAILRKSVISGYLSVSGRVPVFGSVSEEGEKTQGATMLKAVDVLFRGQLIDYSDSRTAKDAYLPLYLNDYELSWRNAPGFKTVLDRYNSLQAGSGAISDSKAMSSLKLNFDAARCVVLHRVAAEVSPYVVAQGEMLGDGALVDLASFVEFTSAKAQSKVIADYLSAYHGVDLASHFTVGGAAGAATANQAAMSAFQAFGVVPLNMHSMTRHTPFAELLALSMTYQLFARTMIEPNFEQKALTDGKYTASKRNSAGDNIFNMHTAFVTNPWVSVSKNGYKGPYSQIMAGATKLPRPAFASDTVFAQVQAQSLTNYVDPGAHNANIAAQARALGTPGQHFAMKKLLANSGFNGAISHGFTGSDGNPKVSERTSLETSDHVTIGYKRAHIRLTAAMTHYAFCLRFINLMLLARARNDPDQKNTLSSLISGDSLTSLQGFDGVQNDPEREGPDVIIGAGEDAYTMYNGGDDNVVSDADDGAW